MADTWLDIINASMGRSQNPNYDDIQVTMGGAQITGGTLTPAPAGEDLYPMASRIYASSVAVNGIPIGNDNTGDGSRANPYLTLDKAYAVSVAGKALLVNGDPAAPTDYRATTIYNFTKAVTLDAVAPFGASISATTTTARVILFNPPVGTVSKISTVIVDGRGLNPNGIETSTSPASTWDMQIGARVRNCITGIFSSTSGAVTSHVRLTLLPSADVLTVNGGACIDNVRLGADASVIFQGGTFVSQTATSGVRAVRLWGVAQGAAVSGSGATITRTAGAANASIDIALELQDVTVNLVAPFTVNASDSTGLAAGLKAIVLAPSTAGATLDMSGWRLSGVAVNHDSPGGGGGIWIGHDSTGTSPSTQADGKLNNGLCIGCTVAGSDASATGGLHGIFNSDKSNSRFTRNRVSNVGLGLVDKGGLNALWDANIIEKCKSSYMLSKGSAGATFKHNTTLAPAGYNVNGLAVTTNPTSTAASTGTVSIGNLMFFADTNPRFVGVDSGQTISTFAQNDYYGASGPGSLSWNYLGTNYATLAAYQAASGEVGSISVNPLLNGYRPTASGLNIVPADGGVTVDYYGAAFASPATVGAVQI